MMGLAEGNIELKAVRGLTMELRLAPMPPLLLHRILEAGVLWRSMSVQNTDVQSNIELTVQY